MTAKYACTRWAVDLSTWTPTLTQLARAVAVVQPEERARLIKFHFIDDFLLSLVGRLLMRKYVAQSTGLPYASLRFKRTANGKPLWEGDDTGLALSFSTSHQGSLVVLAGALAQEASPTQSFGVGVDVMKVEYEGGRTLSEFFRLMQRQFSAEEWLYIRRPLHDEQQQLKAFMRNWCLKEAYTKELGVGITVNLQQISFSIEPGVVEPLSDGLPTTSSVLHVKGERIRDYLFEEYLLHANYCVAIAWHNIVAPIDTFVWLTVDDLLVDSLEAQQIETLDYCRQVLKKQRKQTRP